MVSISFDCIAGHTYRVEFKSDLTAPLWLDVSGPIRAEGSVTSWSGQLTSSGGFYRIWTAED